MVDRTSKFWLGLAITCALTGIRADAWAIADGEVKYHANCNSPFPVTNGPAPLPVTINHTIPPGSRTGSITITAGVADVTASVSVSNAYTTFGPFLCGGGHWIVSDVIFHSGTGAGGTADVAVNGRVVGQTTGSGSVRCTVSAFQTMDWGSGPVTRTNVVVADFTPAALFDEFWTSSPFVSVPLDTPITWIWGLRDRVPGTSCLGAPGAGTYTLDASATAGDLGGDNVDIFVVTNVNANDGGGLVDVTSVEAGISNNRFSPAPVPSGGASIWLAITLVLAGCGVYETHRRTSRRERATS